jgi:S-adenosylmethionine-diacylglycerol 3-amino-3-carboxypropyl transferase
MSATLGQRARFDLVRYANCWEDAEVLCAALAPRPGMRILSIASAGDNSFSLVAAGAQVVAADLSPAQLALVELKRAALLRLDYGDALAFLGVGRPERARGRGPARLRWFARLAEDLSPEARGFWQARPAAIAGGIIHQGKFERYFALFRSRVLPLIHRRRTVERLLAERDEEGRRAFYARRWDNLRWRLLFRVFFSRFVMGRLGRDPEFFRYVEGSVAERILERARYALTVLPTHDNPYLEYILTGGFHRVLPHYLRPEVFAALRRNLERRPDCLLLAAGAIDDVAMAAAAGEAGAAARDREPHPGRGFDGFNLSDIFEYLEPAACAAVYERLLPAANPGARLAYWNMLAPRRHPASAAGRVRPLADEARALFARDRAFFYSAFVLEEVR